MAKKVVASLVPVAVSTATSIASRGYNGLGVGEEFRSNIAPQDSDSTIESLDFDCLMSESVTRKAKMTNYATEAGSPITDHVSLDPIEVKLTGKITSMTDGIVGTAVSNPQSLLGIRSFDDLSKTSYNGGGKIHKAYTTLNSMFEARIPFSIVTGLTVHKGMIITNLTFSRDNPLEEFKFDISLQQLNVTVLEWGQIVESKARAKPTQNRGGKAKTKSTATKKPVETTGKTDRSKLVKARGFDESGFDVTKRSASSTKAWGA